MPQGTFVGGYGAEVGWERSARVESGVEDLVDLRFQAGHPSALSLHHYTQPSSVHNIGVPAAVLDRPTPLRKCLDPRIQSVVRNLSSSTFNVDNKHVLLLPEPTRCSSLPCFVGSPTDFSQSVKGKTFRQSFPVHCPPVASGCHSSVMLICNVRLFPSLWVDTNIVLHLENPARRTFRPLYLHSPCLKQ